MRTHNLKLTLLRLGALTALLFVAGCGGSPEATAEAEAEAGVEAGGASAEGEATAVAEAGVSGLCANTYYPVLEGASHSYVAAGGPGGDFAFTITVSAVREDGFTLTTESDGVTVTQEWACTEEGLVALTYGGGAAGAISVSGSEATYETSDVTGVTLPASIAVGDTWSQTFNITGTQTIPGMEEAATVDGSASASYEAIGEESVETEAGTFTALKVAVTNIIDLTVNVSGISSASLFTSTGHIWYVAGIGWVKSVDSVEIAGGAFETSIELSAYSLPE
jgi:hypothetical protein